MGRLAAGGTLVPEGRDRVIQVRRCLDRQRLGKFELIRVYSHTGVLCRKLTEEGYRKRHEERDGDRQRQRARQQRSTNRKQVRKPAHTRERTPRPQNGEYRG